MYKGNRERCKMSSRDRSRRVREIYVKGQRDRGIDVKGKRDICRRVR